MTFNSDVLIRQYPSGFEVLNHLAGDMFDIDPANIQIGNGAAELIKALLTSIDSNKVGILPQPLTNILTVLLIK